MFSISLIGLSGLLKLIHINFTLAWEPFRDLIPESERGCFIDAYHKRLNSDDKQTQVSLNILALLSAQHILFNSSFYAIPSYISQKFYFSSRKAY